MEKWPEWLRAASYLACAVLIMILVEIVHRRVVRPAVDRLDRAVSALTARQLRYAVEVVLYVAGTAQASMLGVGSPLDALPVEGRGAVHAPPATLSGTGTITNPPSQIS